MHGASSGLSYFPWVSFLKIPLLYSFLPTAPRSVQGSRAFVFTLSKDSWRYFVTLYLHHSIGAKQSNRRTVGMEAWKSCALLLPWEHQNQQNGKDWRSSQETQRYQGNVSCKDGHNTWQKWYLTEAEEIKKRWREYTEKLYKKGLHDPDNHDCLITHLEPDILYCEAKRALESITTNKGSGGDGIPVEIFQILKDDAVKVLHSICQQIWKTFPQDWKRSVFIPIPK